MQWRWRDDQRPGSPSDNMAIDVALFEQMVESPDVLPIVRVYRWDRPAVTIGRLQDEAAVRREFRGLPLVRRPTGGRAVLHGDDLTISVVVRSDQLPSAPTSGVLASYRQIVAGIIAAYETLGVAVAVGSGGRNTGSEDCFHAAARCDLVNAASGAKLAGCAQRRESGVILQQMSLRMSGEMTARELTDAARNGLALSLNVGEWLAVDTPFPV